MLEKGVHEKQNNIITLRKQLEETKQSSIKMRSQLKVIVYKHVFYNLCIQVQIIIISLTNYMYTVVIIVDFCNHAFRFLKKPMNQICQPLVTLKQKYPNYPQKTDNWIQGVCGREHSNNDIIIMITALY